MTATVMPEPSTPYRLRAWAAPMMSPVEAVPPLREEATGEGWDLRVETRACTCRVPTWPGLIVSSSRDSRTSMPGRRWRGFARQVLRVHPMDTPPLDGRHTIGFGRPAF